MYADFAMDTPIAATVAAFEALTAHTGSRRMTSRQKLIAAE